MSLLGIVYTLEIFFAQKWYNWNMKIKTRNADARQILNITPTTEHNGLEKLYGTLLRLISKF